MIFFPNREVYYLLWVVQSPKKARKKNLKTKFLFCRERNLLSVNKKKIYMYIDTELKKPVPAKLLPSLVYKNIKEKTQLSSLIKDNKKAEIKCTVQDDKHTNQLRRELM